MILRKKRSFIQCFLTSVFISFLLIPVEFSWGLADLSCYQSTLSPSLNIGSSLFESNFTKGLISGNGLNETGNNAVLLSQSTKTIRGYKREFSIPENYEDRIEYSARAFLPYTRILTAMNILLRHRNIEKVKKIKVTFEGHDDSAILKDGILNISFQSPEQLSTSEVLRVFKDDLGWDLVPSIKEIEQRYPYLLSDINDFDAINIIIHERLAGLGDLVFVSNAGQIFSKIMPRKKIRVIFHSNDDLQLGCSTKILKGLDPNKAIQQIGGMEIINAEAYAMENFNVGRKVFGVEGQPWYLAQEDIIGENDISLVYALAGTPKEVMADTHKFRAYAGKAKAVMFVHELGFSSLNQDPLSTGDIHFGFGDDQVGMAPVSPVNEMIYEKKYPRVDKQIQSERRRIIKKIMGWNELNTVLGQSDLEKTIASEWGFLYAHNDRSITKYFKTFQRARVKNSKFNKETTFFIMCGRSDKEAIEKVKQLSEMYDYNLFIYEKTGGRLEIYNEARNNNVSIIMDYSVPRKLFSELFLYSDDLPTLVSGQDNLANILYLNLLTTGRPFFWEVLIFQSTAFLDMLIYLRKTVGEDATDRFRNLIENNLGFNDIEDIFANPRKYRSFFKKIAQALDRHKSFISQAYYLMLRFGQNHNIASEIRAKELISKLNSIKLTKDLQNSTQSLELLNLRVSGNALTYVAQSI